ncbi:hypothetical protein BC01_209 [Bacillus phage BC01]|nr:hypothetical protein BC01_209 [Bacillus phage BC01]
MIRLFVFSTVVRCGLTYVMFSGFKAKRKNLLPTWNAIFFNTFVPSDIGMLYHLSYNIRKDEEFPRLYTLYSVVFADSLGSSLIAFSSSN